MCNKNLHHIAKSQITLSKITLLKIAKKTNFIKIVKKTNIRKSVILYYILFLESGFAYAAKDTSIYLLFLSCFCVKQQQRQ
jgi:hypothetical protein